MQDHLQTVVIDQSFHFPRGFPGNYSEFPNSSIRYQLTVLVQHAQVPVDGRHAHLIQLGKLPLRHPDHATLKT